MGESVSWDIVVIGGGPAGLTAAAFAAGDGRRVALIERNELLGRKLLLTGGGRCNVSNMLSLREFIQAMGPGADFLRSALKRFGVEELRAFLAEAGVEMVEKDPHYFIRGGAKELVAQLAALLRRRGVSICAARRVVTIASSATGFTLGMDDGSTISAQRVIVATGGRSYPATGSTGDGWTWAKAFGHRVVAPAPALGLVRLKDKVFEGLAGITVADVVIEALVNDRACGRFSGTLLITHEGVSGPPVVDASLTLSRAIRDGKSAALRIDFLPGVMREAIIKQLNDPDRPTAFLAPLAERLRARLIERSGVIRSGRNMQVSRSARHMLTEATKGLIVDVRDTGTWEQAMVTVGGVALDEIDGKTMESRRVKGLYFIGEVVDVAGTCGGFNVQSAMSMGCVAGESAASAVSGQ